MKKRTVKWFEPLACEEMIGIPVIYRPTGGKGDVVGKVVDVGPSEVTAEISEEVYKKALCPVSNDLLGVQVEKTSMSYKVKPIRSEPTAKEKENKIKD